MLNSPKNHFNFSNHSDPKEQHSLKLLVHDVYKNILVDLRSITEHNASIIINQLKLLVQKVGFKTSCKRSKKI